MSYKMALGPGLIIVSILLAAIVAGIAYFIFPDGVRAALHWWQPKWF